MEELKLFQDQVTLMDFTDHQAEPQLDNILNPSQQESLNINVSDKFKEELDVQEMS